MHRPMCATRSIHKVWFGFVGGRWWKWMRRSPGRRPHLILWSYGPYRFESGVGYRAQVEWSAQMKLPGDPQTGGDREWYAARPKWMIAYLNLARLLLAKRYDGSDQERDPGTISFKWANGWQVSLRDPTTRTIIRAELDTLDGWEKAVEALLAMDTPPWERDDFAKPRIRLKGAAKRA